MEDNESRPKTTETKKSLQFNTKQIEEDTEAVKNKDLCYTINDNRQLWNYLSKEDLNEDNIDHMKDIHKIANILPPQILILGKPKIGKTNVSEMISKRLQIKYISIENIINSAYEYYKLPDEDDQENEEKKLNLTKLQKECIEIIKNGHTLEKNYMLELINE